MIDREEATRAVLSALAEILPDLPSDQISFDCSLGELGADSVDRVEIVAAARDHLHIDRPLSDFGGLSTVSALIDRLAE